MAGRPRKLSKEAIIEAAKSLPGSELGFPQVARKLNVSAQALYRYYPNLAALRADLAGALVELVPSFVPADGETLPDVAAIALAMGEAHASFLKDSRVDPSIFATEFGALRFAGGEPDARLLVRLERWLRVSTDAGLSMADAIMSWHIMADFLGSTDSLRLPTDYNVRFHADLKQMIARSDDLYPGIEQYLAGEIADLEDLFQVSLEAIACGLSRLVERSENHGDARSTQ
jgi:AcrR family transcriptional regulator